MILFYNKPLFVLSLFIIISTTSVIEPASIIPKPKQIVPASTSSPAYVTADWVIVGIPSNYTNFTAQYLANKLYSVSYSTWGGNRVNVSSTLVVADTQTVVSQKSIVLANLKSSQATSSGLTQLASTKGVDINDISDGYQQGYILDISTTQITIFSDGEAGICYL